MNNGDKRTLFHLVTGPDDAVHLLFHLRIPALDRVKVEVLDIISLQHARGGPAPEPDPIGRPSDLNDVHAVFRLILLRMPGIDLADTGGKHDRLQKTPSLAIGKTHIK